MLRQRLSLCGVQPFASGTRLASYVPQPLTRSRRPTDRRSARASLQPLDDVRCRQRGDQIV